MDSEPVLLGDCGMPNMGTMILYSSMPRCELVACCGIFLATNAICEESCFLKGLLNFRELLTAALPKVADILGMELFLSLKFNS